LRFAIHTVEGHDIYVVVAKMGGSLQIGDQDAVGELSDELGRVAKSGEASRLPAGDPRVPGMSVSEAAVEFGVGRRTLRYAIARGEIPGASRQGPRGEWRLPRPSVAYWVQHRPRRGPKGGERKIDQ
jgi:excisionase family DNA binding protein